MAKTYCWRWSWLLLLLAAAAVYPALIWNSGAVAFDAALDHIYRGLIFSDAISEGVLYPRWTQFLNLGLGSPLFTFQGPLPYYGLDLLYRLGLPHGLGWRVLVASGLLAAFLGAYLLVREITGQRWPALLAAAAFLYSPYVLRNPLERGSNEAYSMFLYPWILWGLLWLARRPGTGRFPVATLIWAACIASHVLGPLMLAPVALALAIAAGWRYRTAAPLLALLAGGLLTAGIWAPMASEQAWVQVERDFNNPAVSTWNNSVPLQTLLAWPTVYDTQRENNRMADNAGLLQMGLLVLGIPGTVYGWRRGRRGLAVSLGGMTLLGLLLFWSLTSSSDAGWRLLAPLAVRLQYRIRLMGLQALAASTAGGLLLALVPPRRQPVLGLCVSLACLLAALPPLYLNLRHQWAPFSTVVTQQQAREAELGLGGPGLTAYGEFTPRWRTAPIDAKLWHELGPDFNPQTRPLADTSAGVRVDAARVKSSSWDVSVVTERPTTLTLHLLYYPRWQAFVDGQPTPIRPQADTGYAQVDVPAGMHQLALRYATTTVEAAGLIASSLTLLALLVLAAQAAIHHWRDLRRTSRPGLLFASQVAMAPSANAGPRFESMAPPTWLLLGLTALLGFKAFYVDGNTTWFRCASRQDAVCGAQHAVGVLFAGDMRLRGYSVSAPLVLRGDTLHVNLYWQADHKMTQGLYNFLRLRNGEKDEPANPATGNEIWVEDIHGGPGGFFNTSYLPGRIYADEYAVQIPKNMPPGSYRLEVGWLDVATGDPVDVDPGSVQQPLRILDRSILLAAIEVR